MSYNPKSKSEMTEDELKVFESSLRKDLVTAKERHRQETLRVKKLEEDFFLLGREIQQLDTEIENRIARMRSAENELRRSLEIVENAKNTKKTIEFELENFKKQAINLDVQSTRQKKEIEKGNDELGDLAHNVKRIEIAIRE